MGKNLGESAVSVTAVRHNASRTLHPGCAIPFFLVFFLAGLGVMVMTIAWPLLRVIQARRWAPVECTIVSSQVVSGDGTHSVRIVYDYVAAGQLQRSDRYHFFTGSTSGYDGKAAAVANYPPGSKRTCFVDPDDATQAVLNRSLPVECWFGLFGVPFLLVGGVGLAYTIGWFKPEKWKRSAQPGEDAGISPFSSADSELSAPSLRPPQTQDPVVLKAASSPLGTFVGGLLFTLFWNGIVSVFLWEVVEGFRRGQPEWFSTLFLVPFVVVGIGSMGFVAYSLLAIFTPRPELILSSAEIPLGQSAELQWRFTGSTRSVRRLRITLEGKEEARYRRGTSTTTDTAKFAEISIVDETLPLRIESGATSLQVPTDTIHSFSGTNNKIVWSLVVRGEIGFWPDAQATFPIEVLPHLGRPSARVGEEPDYSEADEPDEPDSSPEQTEPYPQPPAEDQP